MYMECIKYVKSGLVVIEIHVQGVENDYLAVPMNNTLMCRMSLLATDTRFVFLKIYNCVRKVAFFKSIHKYQIMCRVE